jgi:hypothetical protein
MPHEDDVVTASSPKPPAADADVRHDALPDVRIPPIEQEPGFLEDLRLRGAVMPVDEGWTGNEKGLPREVTWVVYPNGDLRRIRI